MASKRKPPSKTKIDRLRTTMKVERPPAPVKTAGLGTVAPDEAVGRILALHVVPDTASPPPLEPSGMEKPKRLSLLRRIFGRFLK